MRRMLVGLVAATLASGALGAKAQEGGSRMWVPDPESRFVGRDEAGRLGEKLRAAARRYSSFALVEDPSLELEALRSKAGCKGSSVRCLAAAGKAAGVDEIFHVQIQMIPGRFQIKMMLVDVRTARAVGQLQRRARSQAALGDVLTGGWNQLVGLPTSRQLMVSANVDGVQLRLDGRAVGETPLVRSLEIRNGSHLITASHPDFVPAEKSFFVKGKQKTVRIRFSLVLKDMDIPTVALVPKDGLRPGKGEPGEGGKLGGGKDEPGEGGKLGGGEDEPGEGGKLGGGKDEPGEGGKLGGGKDEPGDGGELGGDKDEPGSGEVAADAGPGSEQGKPAEPEQDLASMIHIAKIPEQERRDGLVPEDEGEPESDRESAEPIYHQWWFWTAIGAVVVATTVTGTVLGLSGEGGGIPSGMGRVTVEF
ncbi:MAG: PEGA domain-containing protein [Deltaproteobacteria bacterium]|nr:PEGA domain-containing protein [Deltaproteobacteria bacterium]